MTKMNRKKKKIRDLEERIYQIEKELGPECKKKFNKIFTAALSLVFKMIPSLLIS
ncbi:MAG: hypothetical protein NWF10_06800 [Candidatus Bathyarchaeota archaeon]|jgi:hypothetical protein|nr:hypothetical protein [Candidatus Bathyarchaeota archaeon]